MARRNTKTIYVRGVAVGGGAPVTVQSMCNTKTQNVPETLEQIRRLEEAGCEIIRLAVPDMEAVRAFGIIRESTSMPLVADIHFNYRLAVESVHAGADKIRINPGNIGGPENVRAVAEACRRQNVPIRVGVNAGSLQPELLEKFGAATPEAMVASAQEHVRLLNRYDFNDICLSLKASNVPLTVAAYRLAAERLDYPLHLGVTEAGTAFNGTIQSAMGIGALLLDGIGDTVRVSLTDDPVQEVRAGIAILKAAGVRSGGVRFISCPSCGRCEYDLIGTARDMEARLSGLKRDITVAVMGCAVNGPGEARHADYGVAGGKTDGIIFKAGEVVRRAPLDRLADALIEIIEGETQDTYEQA